MRYVVITVFLFFAVMPVFSRGETLKIKSVYPSRVEILTVEKNAFLATDANSKVGIGTKKPGPKLGILGEIGVGGYDYSDSLAPTGGAIIQGNVGIGTTSPTEKLDVVGNIKTSGKVLMGWEMRCETTQALCSNENKKVIGGGCWPSGPYYLNIYSYPTDSGNGWNCTKQLSDISAPPAGASEEELNWILEQKGIDVTACAICASIDK